MGAVAFALLARATAHRIEKRDSQHERGEGAAKAEPRIPLHLSLDDPEPMYRQIESQLRDFILGGQLEPGTRLPSMRALAGTSRAASSRRGGPTRTSRARASSGPDRAWELVAEIPEEKMAAHRREAVDGAFREAVRAGRRAGLTHEELRDILEETLQREDANVHKEARHDRNAGDLTQRREEVLRELRARAGGSSDRARATSSLS